MNCGNASMIKGTMVLRLKNSFFSDKAGFADNPLEGFKIDLLKTKAKLKKKLIKINCKPHLNNPLTSFHR